MLKPYIGYSRSLGASDGAILIFANSAREAKKIGFPYVDNLLTFEFTDFAVNRLWDRDFVFVDADPNLVKGNIPHVIDNPTCCEDCGYFGHEKINPESGICIACENESSLQLRLYTQ
jgi:hypothetical protein